MTDQSNAIITHTITKRQGKENLALPSDDLLKPTATAQDKVDFHSALLRAQFTMGNRYMLERLRFEIDRITAIEEVREQWVKRGLKDG